MITTVFNCVRDFFNKGAAVERQAQQLRLEQARVNYELRRRVAIEALKSELQWDALVEGGHVADSDDPIAMLGLRVSNWKPELLMRKVGDHRQYFTVEETAAAFRRKFHLAAA